MPEAQHFQTEHFEKMKLTLNNKIRLSIAITILEVKNKETSLQIEHRTLPVANRFYSLFCEHLFSFIIPLVKNIID